MDRDNVFVIFCRLTGLDSEQAADFVFMCDTACDYVLSRIRDGADISGCGGALELAAATLAYYRYVLWGLTEGQANEVKVGDISVKAAGAAILDSASRLCREAFDEIAPYLEDVGFVFRGVPDGGLL